MAFAFRLRFLLVMLALLAASARPTRATMTLTLTDPNPTVALGASTVNYVFRGDLQLDPGYTVTSAGVPYLFQAGLATYLEPLPLLPSQGTNVALFRVSLPPSTAVGLYDRTSLGTPAEYELFVKNAAGDTQKLSAAFTLNVTQAVPEPSAWISASLAVAASVGVGGLRLFRRRAA